MPPLPSTTHLLSPGLVVMFDLVMTVGGGLLPCGTGLYRQSTHVYYVLLLCGRLSGGLSATTCVSEKNVTLLYLR